MDSRGFRLILASKDMKNGVFSQKYIFFREQNIASQSVTPFILARVNELTQGASMATSKSPLVSIHFFSFSDIALLENNASIAGRLAAKLCDRRPIAISQMKKNSSIPIKPKVVSSEKFLKSMKKKFSGINRTSNRRFRSNHK